MKTISLITILASLLATTSAAPAVPYASEQIEILVSVNGHSASKHRNNRVVNIKTMDTCLPICSPTPRTCDDPWYSSNLGTDDGPCWTCCINPN